MTAASAPMSADDRMVLVRELVRAGNPSVHVIRRSVTDEGDVEVVAAYAGVTYAWTEIADLPAD